MSSLVWNPLPQLGLPRLYQDWSLYIQSIYLTVPPVQIEYEVNSMT